MMAKSFIIFASCLLVLICTTNGGPVQPTFEVFRNSSQFCNTGSVFLDSREAKACGHMLLPAENEKLSNTNERQFLCVGLYDRVGRLCYIGSMRKLPSSEWPANSDEFDAKMNTMFPRKTTNVSKFCQSWNNTYSPTAESTLAFVNQLDNALKNVLTCVKICARFDEQLEPLCVVLASMDQISQKIAPVKETLNHSSRDPTAVEATAQENGEKKAQKESSTDDPTKKVHQTGNEKIEVPKSGEGLIPGRSNIIKESHKQALQPEAGTPVSVSTKNNATLDRVPTNLQTEKLAGSKDATRQHQLEHKQEEEGTKVESAQKTEQNNARDSVETTNAENKTPYNSQINGPQVDGEVGLLGRENLEADVQKNPGNEQQDEDNGDVISEHTQNDDQLTGGRVPPEDLNEMEPPVVHASDEDLNEAPAQPAVKHGYVSGMRGIRDDDESHVFGYFTVIGVICIAGYVGYHNKQKILAIVLEGRRSRGGRGRRRPSTANYRKLDCTLEEAVTSQCNSNVTHVIY